MHLAFLQQPCKQQAIKVSVTPGCTCAKCHPKVPSKLQMARSDASKRGGHSPTIKVQAMHGMPCADARGRAHNTKIPTAAMQRASFAGDRGAMVATLAQRTRAHACRTGLRISFENCHDTDFHHGILPGITIRVTWHRRLCGAHLRWCGRPAYVGQRHPAPAVPFKLLQASGQPP